ncbi:MAG: hypothetical protein AB7U45_03440 [Desulfamplus sp.]
METLKDFSENQKNYLLYQSRLDAQYERNTWENMMRESEIQLKEQKIKLKEQEVKLKEQEIKLAIERQEKEKALKIQEKERLEKERYLKILKEKGIDIDTIVLSSEVKTE